MNVAILFSGRGSNMRSIIEMSQSDKSVDVSCVITDNPNAPGIEIANEYEIPVVVILFDNGQNKEECFDSISTVLDKFNVSLVALAGFMRILPKKFCERWEGKCINIHPSLLPKYKGTSTHQRVLDAGDEWSGLSIHFVTEDLDGGPLIAQEPVRVSPSDTAETLENRILSYEHLMYPSIVSSICRGIIYCIDGVVYHYGERLMGLIDFGEMLSKRG